MGMMLWGVKGKLSVQVILAQPGTILVTGIRQVFIGRYHTLKHTDNTMLKKY